MQISFQFDEKFQKRRKISWKFAYILLNSANLLSIWRFFLVFEIFNKKTSYIKIVGTPCTMRPFSNLKMAKMAKKWRKNWWKLIYILAKHCKSPFNLTRYFLSWQKIQNSDFGVYEIFNKTCREICTMRPFVWFSNTVSFSDFLMKSWAINWCNLLNLVVLPLRFLALGPGEHVKWGHKHVHNL